LRLLTPQMNRRFRVWATPKSAALRVQASFLMWIAILFGFSPCLLAHCERPSSAKVYASGNDFRAFVTFSMYHATSLLPRLHFLIATIDKKIFINRSPSVLSAFPNLLE